MKKLTIETAEELALKMRKMLRVGASQPLNMKTALRQLNIMTIYRPLSDGTWGDWFLNQTMVKCSVVGSVK